MPCKLCHTDEIEPVINTEKIIACSSCTQILVNSSQQQIMAAYKIALEKGATEKANALRRFLYPQNRVSGKSPVTDNASKNPLLMLVYKEQKSSKATTPQTPIICDKKGPLSAICEMCGNAFPARRSDAKFCSPRCRQKAKRAQVAESELKRKEQLLAS